MTDRSMLAATLRAGAAALAEGRSDAARRCFGRALALAPDRPEPWLGLARLPGDAAAAAARLAWRLAPYRAAAALAVAAADVRRPTVALRAAGAALALAPGDPRGWTVLGECALLAGRFALAAGSLLQAFRLDPGARARLAPAARLAAGRAVDGPDDPGAETLAALAALYPGDADLAAAAAAGLRWRDPAASERALGALLWAEPVRRELWWHLGQARHRRDAGGPGAGAALRRAAALAPGWAQAHRGLSLLAEAADGDLARSARHAAAAFALLRDAADARAIRRHLVQRLYVEDDPAALLRGERRAAALWPAGRDVAGAPPPPRATTAPLRVGYLATALLGHVVSRNMGPVLAAHDPARVRPVLYLDQDPAVAGPVPTRWAHHARRFVHALDDDALAARIRADALDLLVVLAGHFDECRLHLLARRLAPVQASYHDGGTSGLAHADLMIADPVLLPRAIETAFSERVARLPVFTVYDPETEAVAPAPPAPGDPVRLAAFGNPQKIGDATLDLWAAVLRAAPGARLVLRYRDAYARPALRDRVAGRLAARGVDPARLAFRWGEADNHSFLVAHRGIHLALDTTPFNGMHTTFMALWMGVPVVTLAAGGMMGRQSATLLAAIGRPGWIARTAAEAAAVAAGLLADPTRLAAERTALRPLVRRRLCDGPRFTRRLERLYAAACRQATASPGGRGRPAR